MANTTNTAGYLASEHSRVHISFDGGSSFTELIGAMSITESGGEGGKRDVVPMAGGVSANPTRARVPQVQIELYALPQLSFHSQLRAAKDNGDLILCRYETQQKNLLSELTGRQVEVEATTGTVTATDTTATAITNFLGTEYGVGQALVVGSDNFIIDDIDDAGVATVANPPQADATGTYRLIIPAIQRGPFSATVLDFDQLQVAAEDEIKMTMVLLPRAQLPETTVKDAV